MSEGSISQEEIDALLSGVDVGGLGSGGSFNSAPEVDIDVPTLQNFSGTIKDKLAEVIKNMTEKDTVPGSPTVEAIGRDQLLAKLPEEAVAVMADFSSGLSGDHLFLMSPEFATKLVGYINKEENPALDDMGLSVISEVVSSHSGAEITELSKGGKLPGLATNPPEAVKEPKAMIRMPQGTFACFTYPVTVGGEQFTLWEAVSGSAADGMARALGGGSKPASQPASSANSGMESSSAMGGAPQMSSPSAGFTQQPMMGGMQLGVLGMQQLQRNPAMFGCLQMGVNMMGMQQMPNPSMMGGMQMQTPPNVQSLQFPNFAQSVGGGEQGNINLIMDVFMEMTVELGRTKKTIKDILGLGEGTIIELDKLAGEPVDFLVNHKPIAKGEVVVIDENFGVRVTEILPSLEHVASSM